MMRLVRIALTIPAAALFTVGCASSGTPVGHSARNAAPAWELTFAEEGDGAKGAALDPAKWSHDVGGGGWGNEERQTYTPGNANASFDGEGHLVIEARREPATGPDEIARDYTSARVKTVGLFEQRYGRVEARLKLPLGKGIWPAFWMLGTTIAEVGWPACGEIDIMENVGVRGRVHGTLHGPGYSGAKGLQGSFDLPEGEAFSDEFHTFAVEWEPREIRWYVDGKQFHARTPDDAGTNAWAFDVPHFLILNLAVGGGWPGYPDATTTFPQRLVVDYVRVYRDANLAIDQAAQAAYHAERIKRQAVAAESKRYRDKGPIPIPGVVLASHFRPGGEGVGYHDADAANQGGAYRPDEGVDMGTCDDPSVEYSVGWTRVGEWMAYDVNVAEAGTYRVEARVACLGNGGVMSLTAGKAEVSGSVPDTGGWNTWKSVDLGTVDLTAGVQVVRLTMASAGPSGEVGSVAKLTFTRVR